MPLCVRRCAGEGVREHRAQVWWYGSIRLGREITLRESALLLAATCTTHSLTHICARSVVQVAVECGLEARRAGRAARRALAQQTIQQGECRLVPCTACETHAPEPTHEKIADLLRRDAHRCTQMTSRATSGWSVVGVSADEAFVERQCDF